MSIRPISFSSQARPAMEGAGVHLHRVFGFGETEPFDPFLMIRRPPRSTHCISSAASDVYKRQATFDV